MNIEEIPILDKCIQEEPVLTPDFFFSVKKENIKKKEQLEKLGVDSAIFIFAKEEIKEKIKAESQKFFSLTVGGTKEEVVLYKNKCLVFFAQIGGPQAGLDVEELSFFGIKNFFAVGSCGLLGKDVEKEEIILVEKAIRDEGLSYHYLQPSLYVETSTSLTQKLEKQIRKQGFKTKRGITCTTDAFYRETKSIIEKRKNQGAICVEMEAASFAAVCKRKGFNFATALYSSDGHSEEDWKKHISKEEKLSVLEKLFNACVGVIEND